MKGPFWRYFGGKWRAAPRYPAPTHPVIIEPFAGAAGYACWWFDRDVLLIEKDPVIAGIWKWLIGSTPEDVLAVPDVPDGGTVDDIDAPKPARDLVGFWCNQATTTPRKRRSSWVHKRRHLQEGEGGWCSWTAARPRVARSVRKIRHWQVICGDYSEAPDEPATWFIDPPYQAVGHHYTCSDVDYPALAAWVLERRGQVIVCEQQGADWLPWTGRLTLRSTRGTSKEVVYYRGGLFR